jgi:hypothetical protein
MRIMSAIGELESAGEGSSEDVGARDERDRFLFRGHAKPGCSAFMITEFGFSGTLKNNENRRVVADMIYSFDGGVMKNLNARWAVGGTGLFALSFFDHSADIVARVGIKPRIRYWLNRNVGLDISPGLVFYPGARRLGNTGFSGQVGVSFGDYATITGHIEIYDWQMRSWDFESETWLTEEGTAVSTYAGIRLGSYAGAGASVLPFILFVLIAGL